MTSSTSSLTRRGQVYTFGSGVGGELGLGGSIHERRKPGLLRHLPSDQVVDVQCGGQHSLALTADGRVFSWGINDQGALGRTVTDVDSDSDSDDDANTDTNMNMNKPPWMPAPVLVPHPVTQMVCADSFSAVLTTEGTVYAWGSFRDPSGVIGFSKGRPAVQPLPVLVHQLGRSVVRLGAGDNAVFAVTSDGALWAFGANDEGQLGRRVSSRLQNNLVPYQIRPGSAHRHPPWYPVRAVTGGSYHTLLLNERGELYAFGCNNCGQLGLGDTATRPLGHPEHVQYAIADDGRTRIPLPPIVHIAAGESHSLAVAVDGRVFAWGANLEGQLGLRMSRPVYGDERDAMDARLAEVVVLPSKKSRRKNTTATDDVSSSSAPSSAHTSPEKSLTRSVDYKQQYQPLPRQLPVVGANHHHNDSDDDDDDDDARRRGLPADDPVVSVSAQSRFSCAVTRSGRLYTWGSGHSYQLGNEELQDEPIPYQVNLKDRVCFAASCGGQFLMFLLLPKDADATTMFNAPAPASFKSSFRGTVAPSSLPASPLPFGAAAAVSSTMDVSPAVKPTTTERSSSPTHVLSTTFDQVCVSPERKRARVDSVTSFTAEEKMAPWSPTRPSRPLDTYSSPLPLLIFELMDRSSTMDQAAKTGRNTRAKLEALRSQLPPRQPRRQ